MDTAIYLTTLSGLFAVIAYIRKRNGYSYHDIVLNIKEEENICNDSSKFKVELLDEEEQEEELKKERKLI